MKAEPVEKPLGHCVKTDLSSFIQIPIYRQMLTLPVRTGGRGGGWLEMTLPEGFLSNEPKPAKLL